MLLGKLGTALQETLQKGPLSVFSEQSSQEGGSFNREGEAQNTWEKRLLLVNMLVGSIILFV